MLNCTVINNETGEIINENFKIQEIEDTIRKKEYAEKDKLSKEFKDLQQEYLGSFIFYMFKDMQSLQNILTDADLVKFIYIGSYIKNNGALMMDNNITYIDKKKLRHLLQVSDKPFKQFYDKLIENKLLLEKDNNLYINLNFFWRGKENTYKNFTGNKLKDYSRVYIKTIRQLYDNMPKNNHKRIAMVYKLLPYVNWKYNVLCKNIDETEKSNIDVLTIGDVVDLLSYDKTHITRFKKDFYSLKYNNYNIFVSIQHEPNYLQSIILVNPLLFYRGNDIKELEYLITLFSLKPTDK